MLLILGGQTLSTGGYMKMYGLVRDGHPKSKEITAKWLNYHSLEKELLAGSLVLVVGLLLGLKVMYTWISSGYGSLSEVKSAAISMVFAFIGLQMIFSAIVLSVMLLEVDTDW
jgi:hypothetical protein